MHPGPEAQVRVQGGVPVKQERELAERRLSLCIGWIGWVTASSSKKVVQELLPLELRWLTYRPLASLGIQYLRTPLGSSQCVRASAGPWANSAQCRLLNHMQVIAGVASFGLLANAAAIPNWVVVWMGERSIDAALSAHCSTWEPPGQRMLVHGSETQGSAQGQGSMQGQRSTQASRLALVLRVEKGCFMIVAAAVSLGGGSLAQQCAVPGPA